MRPGLNCILNKLSFLNGRERRLTRKNHQVLLIKRLLQFLIVLMPVRIPD